MSKSTQTMSKSTPDFKTHVASTHTAAFLALIKCSYVEADLALLCKNLPNFMGGSGTTLNLLGAFLETFDHPKTTVSPECWPTSIPHFYQ